MRRGGARRSGVQQSGRGRSPSRLCFMIMKQLHLFFEPIRAVRCTVRDAVNRGRPVPAQKKSQIPEKSGDLTESGLGGGDDVLPRLGVFTRIEAGKGGCVTHFSRILQKKMSRPGEGAKTAFFRARGGFYGRRSVLSGFQCGGRDGHFVVSDVADEVRSGGY